MRSYNSAAVLLAVAALGFTGCNGRDRGHDHDRVVERTVVEPTVVEHPVIEQRDRHRDERPCDHVRDPRCDDRPR